MIRLSLSEIDAFSHEVVAAIGRYGPVVVYYLTGKDVFRYSPPGGAAAERAVEDNRMVGLYEAGVGADEVYVDCMWYLSQHGIQVQ